MHKGASIYDVCKIFGICWPPPPLVRIWDWCTELNSRNLPYYIFFWANPPSVRTSYMDDAQGNHCTANLQQVFSYACTCAQHRSSEFGFIIKVCIFCLQILRRTCIFLAIYGLIWLKFKEQFTKPSVRSLTKFQPNRSAHCWENLHPMELLGSKNINLNWNAGLCRSCIQYVLYIMDSWFGTAWAGLPAFIDSVGTAKKCHCKRNVTVTRIFSIGRSFFGPKKCHSNRNVTLTGVTVSGVGRAVDDPNIRSSGRMPSPANGYPLIRMLRRWHPYVIHCSPSGRLGLGLGWVDFDFG